MQNLEELRSERADLVDTWAATCYGEDGSLKRNIYYGNACAGEAVQPDGVFVWVGKDWKPGQDSGEDARIIAHIDRILASFPNATVHAQTKRAKDTLSERFSQVMTHEPMQEYASMAVSGTVISIGILPAIFRKRPGQRHIHIVTAGELERTRYLRAAFGISCLMSANYLIARDASQMDQLVDLYQLEGVCKGSFVLESEALSDDGASLYELLGDASRLPSYTLESSRKPVLIFFDGDTTSMAYQHCTHLLSVIDYDRYDVTIVTQGFAKAVAVPAIAEQLDPRVRIIARMGSFSCSLYDFTSIQLVNETLLESEDAVAYAELIPQHILKEEVDRILPGMHFDSFVYCAKTRKLWMLISHEIPADHKSIMQFEWWSTVLMPGSHEVRVNSTTNFTRLMARAFDSVCVINSEMREGLAALIEDTPCLLWAETLSYRRCADEAESDTRRIKVGGNAYLVLSTTTMGKRQQALVVEEPDADGTTYATVIRSKDIAEVTSHFARMRRTNPAFKDSTLYAFIESKGLSSPTTIVPSVPSYIRIINLEAFEGPEAFERYVRLFSGYVSFGDDDACALRLLMESLGIECWAHDSAGTLTKLPTSELDVERYGEICTQRLAQILGC